MRRKAFRAPFVVTLAMAAVPLSCGGDSTDGSGGSGGSGGTDGGIDGGGCPAEAPPLHYGPACADGLVCSYDLTCNSGTVTHAFECVSGKWALQAQACDKPHDECSGKIHCSESGTWSPPPDPNYNPPGPCPTTKPTEGQSCMPGGFGQDPSFCGYPCDPATGSGWTVAECAFNSGQPSQWTYDGACSTP